MSRIEFISLAVGAGAAPDVLGGKRGTKEFLWEAKKLNFCSRISEDDSEIYKLIGQWNIQLS